MSAVVTEKHHEAASHDCCSSSGDFKTHRIQDDVPVVDHESNDMASFIIDGMTGTSCVCR